MRFRLWFDVPLRDCTSDGAAFSLPFHSNCALIAPKIKLSQRTFYPVKSCIMFSCLLKTCRSFKYFLLPIVGSTVFIFDCRRLKTKGGTVVTEVCAAGGCLTLFVGFQTAPSPAANTVTAASS